MDLGSHERALLGELAELIRRFGADRFVTTKLVRADLRDFPDRWEPTIRAVHAVLYRLFWHAYIDSAIVVEDVRAAAPPDHRRLTSSEIELGEAAHGRTVFHVASIGNDDVAGALAHQVGTAFLLLAPPDPFREAAPDPTDAQGSLAAVFLGLGVLAANSARYQRRVSEIVGNSILSEQQIATAGGLEQHDLAFLLAVQDIVRDEPQDALATLAKIPAALVSARRDELVPHKAELRTLLALDDAPQRPLSRSPGPPQPADVSDRDLRKFNSGVRVFRVPFRSWNPPLLLGTLGTAGFLLGPIVGAGTALAGLIAGRVMSKPGFRCSDPSCEAITRAELPICPGCGGTTAGTIKHASYRLDAEEEHEEREAGGADQP